MKQPVHIVSAALVHNIFRNGDFGDSIRRLTVNKRWLVRRRLGTKIEKLLVTFFHTSWNKDTTSHYLTRLDSLTAEEKESMK